MKREDLRFYLLAAPYDELAAEAYRLPLSTLNEIEETAVLAEEVDPILAVRVAGRWFEVYRWLKRPYVLSDDEARHMAAIR